MIKKGGFFVERELALLLVEDDSNECAAFTQYINSVDGVNLIAVTNSSYKGVEYVVDFKPDAVILDLELHQGAGSGLLFLNELKRLELEKPPYILITTNNMSEITYNQARILGADFIMQKHQDDYSVKSVVDFLNIMKDTIFKSSASRVDNRNIPLVSESIVVSEQKIDKKINRELELIGISPKVIGKKYLFDAIKLVINGYEGSVGAELAKKYNKTDASVERAMQNAINKAWRTTDIEDLSINYTARISSEKGVPTMTEFIYYYADKLKEFMPIQEKCI